MLLAAWRLLGDQHLTLYLICEMREPTDRVVTRETQCPQPLIYNGAPKVPCDLSLQLQQLE